MNNTILINCLAVQDSGGITVLDKLLSECMEGYYEFLIICNQNYNMNSIVLKYNLQSHFKFLLIENKGFLHRLYYENIIFRTIIKENNIKLVYNFSGSTQFFTDVPQITKVHNLLFYSEKIDKVYFEKKEYVKWLKQIFLKRAVFHIMIKQVKYIEVQSKHVKEYMNDFINTSKKQFFLKSDIDTNEKSFNIVKNYNFTKKIKFLYIVGPHFEYLHKNFEDFVQSMLKLKQENFDFEIIVTLTKTQLHNSTLWDKSLDEKTIFLGYVSKDVLNKQFQDNTILISTSVIETLGLHVIEAVQNGILAIVPNEKYSLSVYGDDILTYELFDVDTLVNVVKNINLQDNSKIKDIIGKNQDYLIQNESSKYKNIVGIFDEILKEKNV